MISLTKSKVTASQIIALCQYHFNASPQMFTELNDGFYNISYLIVLADNSEVVLKIAPPKDVEILTYEIDIMKTEVEFYKLASFYTDIPVPTILADDFSGECIPYPYYFMSKLHGMALNKIGDISPAMRKEIYTQKAAMLAKLHSIKGETFGYVSMKNVCEGKSYFESFKVSMHALLEDGHRKKTGFPIREADIIETLDECADAFNEVLIPSMVHFDLWDGNIFVSSKEDLTIEGLIDFERGFYGDPSADICQAAGYIDLDVDTYFFDVYNQYATEPIQWNRSMKIRTYTYRLYLFIIMHVECFYRDVDGSFEPQKQWVLKEFDNVYQQLCKALA